MLEIDDSIFGCLLRRIDTQGVLCTVTFSSGFQILTLMGLTIFTSFTSFVDLDPVPLSKVGTHLLASQGSIGKDMNSLTFLSFLRNASSYFATTYCMPKEPY